MSVAVIGGGWAGLAAAVESVRRGHRVTVFEAARQWGGRARALEVTLDDGRALTLDNGQHIMIGAYRETLALMRTVGIEPRDVLRRLPLTLRFPDGQGLALPEAPAPLDAAWGILTARGWSWSDKLSLLKHSTSWQLRRFQCDEALTVAALCEGLAPAVMRDLVEPLCVAALNIPAGRASASVFLRVLRDGLFGPSQDGWGASNLLLPMRDLGALFPEAAANWLQSKGAVLRVGHRVQSLSRDGKGWSVDGERFDEVLLAASPWEAERLVAGSGAAAEAWLAHARGLAHEPIATVYVQDGPSLPLPMLALNTAPAQFVFDRSQLGGPAGVLAFVASASEGGVQELEEQVLAQAHALGWRVRPLKTVVEKRATFACVPSLRRPGIDIAPGLLACGDYVEGPYPATLEGAVRAALAAAARLSPATRTAPSAS